MVLTLQVFVKLMNPNPKNILKEGREFDKNDKAKMLQFVRQIPGADPEKVKNFKASDMWLQGFQERKGITARVQTNKKSRSQFKRSRLVRNFHWYAMYKAALRPSTRRTQLY